LPTQGDAMVAGIDPIDYINKQLQDILKPPSTEDYLAVSMISRHLSFATAMPLFLKSDLTVSFLAGIFGYSK